MTILLLADHTNEALADATGKAVAAAKEIGGDITVLVAGHNCRPAAEAASKLEGVAKVLIADAPQFAHGLAEEVAPLLVSLAGSYKVILVAA
nr:electron transfer flavoprotein subunit alpha/FixB family protein [Alphaproteobacteria bacterium]